MKYDELKCHDCGKHLGSIIDTWPRGMSFCDKHSDVDTSPQTEQAEASSLSDLLVSMNDLIDTIRNLQYEAESKNSSYDFIKTLRDGKVIAYKQCAELLTEIVKAH